MKQRHRRRLAYLLGCMALTGLGVTAACSSDEIVPLPGGDTFTNPDSGKKTTSNSSGQSSGQSTSGGSSSGDDDDIPDAAGYDCSAAPKLHATTQGFYCAFYKGGDPDAAGGTANCTNDTTCCNPGKNGSSFPASYCAGGDKGNNGIDNCTNGAGDNGSTWVTAGGTTWECGASSNCGGSKCCAFSVPGADAGNYINYGKDTQSKAPPQCSPQYVYKIGGTRCAADCDPDSELELCSSTDACSNGATCIPAGTTGTRDLGICKKAKSTH